MGKNISIIAALADNYVIGGNNELLWHISDDLKRFKKLTSGHTIIMGKKTYLSLPIRPLPNRKNVVLSKTGFSDSSSGYIVVSTVEEALREADSQEETFVIGGGEIYKLFLPLVNKMYLTRIHRNFEGDTFFPEFAENEWELKSEERITTDPQNEFDYSFQLWVRKT